MTAELTHWYRRKHSWLWWLLNLLLSSAGITPAAPRALIAQKNCIVWAWSLIWDTCQKSPPDSRQIIWQLFLSLNLLYPKLWKTLGEGSDFQPLGSWAWFPRNPPCTRVFTLRSLVGSHKHSSVTECYSTTAARIKCAITPATLSKWQRADHNGSTSLSPPGQPSLGESSTLQTWYQQSSSRATGEAEAVAYTKHSPIPVQCCTHFQATAIRCDCSCSSPFAGRGCSWLCSLATWAKSLL